MAACRTVDPPIPLLTIRCNLCSPWVECVSALRYEGLSTGNTSSNTSISISPSRPLVRSGCTCNSGAKGLSIMRHHASI